MPLKVPAQGPPEPSFVVKLGYTKIDLPSSAGTTCMAVFPDGRFHMEQTSEVLSSAPRVFENLLPDESLKSLSAILEAPELKELKSVKTDPVGILNGEIVRAVIPRGTTTQKLQFAGVEAAWASKPKPFPASLDPLVQWVRATTKALDQRKLQPLQRAKSVNCWLTER